MTIFLLFIIFEKMATQDSSVPAFRFCYWFAKRENYLSPRSPHYPIESILFAPSHLLVSGASVAVLVGAYRERSHLRPLCKWNRHWSTLPAIYWLLLLSEYVEVNPAPWTHRSTTISNFVCSQTRKDHTKHLNQITSNLLHDQRPFWRWLNNTRR